MSSLLKKAAGVIFYNFLCLEDFTFPQLLLTRENINASMYINE